MLGLGSTIKEITGNSLRFPKEKNGKAHVKKSATLLNIYYFTSTFQGILLGLKQFVLLLIKTGFINTILLRINLYIQEGSFALSYLLFDFSPVKRWERQTPWKKNTKSFFSCFTIIFSIRTLWERVRHPRCFKKSSVGLQNLMSTTLLNIYYFTSTFQGILLGLKQFMLLLIKTGFINAILLKINLYIQEVSSLSYLLCDFSPVKRREKTNSLEKGHKIIFFLFHNNFIHKNTVGESEAPLLLQKEKRGSAKSDLSKVLFPDIGKITNRLPWPIDFTELIILAAKHCPDLKHEHGQKAFVMLSGFFLLRG